MCIFVAVSFFGLCHCLRLPAFVLLSAGMCTLVLTRGKVELSHICWPKERRQPQFTGSHPVKEPPGYRLMVSDSNMLQQSGSGLSGYSFSVGVVVFRWCSEWECWGLLWAQLEKQNQEMVFWFRFFFLYSCSAQWQLVITSSIKMNNFCNWFSRPKLQKQKNDQFVSYTVCIYIYQSANLDMVVPILCLV